MLRRSFRVGAKICTFFWFAICFDEILVGHCLTIAWVCQFSPGVRNSNQITWWTALESRLLCNNFSFLQFYLQNKKGFVSLQCHCKWQLLEQNKASRPKRDALFFSPLRFGPKGVVCNPPESVSQALIIITMKGNGFSPAGTKLQVEVRMPGLVRVKSYTRIQNGKPVKVRSSATAF